MKQTQNLQLTALAVTIGLFTSANGATISVSGTAPTVTTGDFSNLGTATGSELVFSDRPVQGQTFTSSATGGILNSVTVQVYESAENAPIEGWKDWQLRFGTINTGDNTINPQVVTVDRYEPDAAIDSYFTFTFDSAIALVANTLYGFDIGVAGSQEGWQSGIPSLRTTGNDFSGGQRYSGSKPNEIDNTTGAPFDITLQNNDLVFHADIDAIPEPTVAGLAGLGLLLLLRRHRG